MSSPAPEEVGATDERTQRRQSIGRYVKRLRTVLRRGSSARGVPAASSTQPEPIVEPQAAEATPDAPATPAPAPAPAPVQSEEVPSSNIIVPDPEYTSLPITQLPPVTSTLGANSYVRTAAQQERARALFAKYGLTLDSHEWLTTNTTTNIQRVEKPIRMRVRRACHRCQTTFGTDRICTNCEHKRCKKCPRFPEKNTEKKSKDTMKEGYVGEMGEYMKIRAKPNKALLTEPIRPSQQDPIYRPIKQRVRRVCHRCNTTFLSPLAKTCENCSHVRCTKCPREPAKYQKWPQGYPGDEAYNSSDEEGFNKVEQWKPPRRTYRKPRQRVRWNCQNCDTLFVSRERNCAKCGHERCENCKRSPSKKIKQEPVYDPEVVRSLEAKLAHLALRGPQHMSATAA
ncbi:hypothetical protein M501DRAFT_934494 [Patellaria atrata CBS 101060]|uniref:Uncharacterized protein n=1 Tax=Patellaria atrata CBS 101060 TaxID=1346257 RepID=A0A9P4SA93_9PEZI|nr:hypothetical protein M501DRAFT_934494 [Patellaria atrata CBS 101060]